MHSSDRAWRRRERIFLAFFLATLPLIAVAAMIGGTAALYLGGAVAVIAVLSAVRW